MRRFLILLTLPFTLLFSASTACITNFGHPLCHDIQPTSHIIIKSPLSKKALSAKLNRSLQQIAFLGENNLYRMESVHPIEESQILNAQPDILYAQPDVIQKRDNAAYDSQKLSRILNSFHSANKGKGVRIAIIDDGFNLKHEDLQGVDVAFTYDADEKNLDASDKLPIDTHGTQVAGIIFAQHNGIGVDGIAPDASLIAIRQPENRTSDTVLSFTVAALAGADIINCSWNSPALMEPVYDVITHLAKTGREGKGIAIVFAAGNDQKKLTPLSTEASIPDVITIGATQRYSNYGKNVDFILPSGFQTTKSGGGYGLFGGTSATAPVISGLLALELAENRNLPLDSLIQNLKKKLHAF